MVNNLKVYSFAISSSIATPVKLETGSVAAIEPGILKERGREYC
jgi:uncharacterized membrane protein